MDSQNGLKDGREVSDMSYDLRGLFAKLRANSPGCVYRLPRGQFVQRDFSSREEFGDSFGDSFGNFGEVVPDCFGQFRGKFVVRPGDISIRNETPFSP